MCNGCHDLPDSSDTSVTESASVTSHCDPASQAAEVAVDASSVIHCDPSSHTAEVAVDASSVNLSQELIMTFLETVFHKMSFSQQQQHLRVYQASCGGSGSSGTGNNNNNTNTKSINNTTTTSGSSSSSGSGSSEARRMLRMPPGASRRVLMDDVTVLVLTFHH